MKKVLVSIYVLKIDKLFDIELPINLPMSTVISSIQDTIKEITNNSYLKNESARLYESNTGKLINLNNIVKFSGIKNGDKLLLI